MPRKQPYRAIAAIDPGELAAFRAGIRKRYTDDQIVAELRACAERLGRSPTMREFAADPATTVHPQTVIEHFGSWNNAKRVAGLVPRRFDVAGGSAVAAGRLFLEHGQCLFPAPGRVAARSLLRTSPMTRPSSNA